MRKKKKRKYKSPQYATIEEYQKAKSEEGRINAAKRKSHGGPPKKSPAQRALESFLKDIGKDDTGPVPPSKE